LPYRAVLFDLDGTLLDTLEDLAAASNAALARLGCPLHPVPRYKIWIGDGLDNLVQSILPPQRRGPETLAECRALIREEYAGCWADRTRPYDGVGALLDALTARAVPMAVLSNKPHDFAQQCVARLLPGWSFAVVLGQRAETPRKPHPAGALEIARQLRLPAAEILYLGDTNTDMQTAVSAGMYPVGALWGFRDAQELREAGAQRLVRRPEELLEVLGIQKPVEK
jgi:phosphoglycolate phosphatase